MKRSNIIGQFLGVFALFTAVSCTRVYHYDMNTYAQVIHIWSAEDGLNVRPDGNYFTVRPNTQRIVDFLSEGEDGDLFDEISALNGDNTYDRRVSVIDNIFTRAYYYPNLAGITITSDSDYDEDHPAVAVLNDCFKTSCGAGRYVDSGYDDDYFRYTYDNIYKSLDEMEIVDYKMNGVIEISPCKEPADDETHILTVTVTDEYGNVFTNSIAYSKGSGFTRI